MTNKKYGEDSEIFKTLLHDFLNFKTTGWKPFAKNVGGDPGIKRMNLDNGNLLCWDEPQIPFGREVCVL